MKNNIKFIYFDVGGVVIKDFSGTNKWEELKVELGIPKDKSQEFEDIYDLYQDEINTTREIEIAKSKYKIGLLTNMYPNMLPEIKRAGLLPDVEFDQIIDSSVEKVQKPYKEIYELAEKRCGFKGDEILFIDNSQKHLDSARQLGWQTFLYDPTDTKKSSEELMNIIDLS